VLAGYGVDDIVEFVIGGIFVRRSWRAFGGCRYHGRVLVSSLTVFLYTCSSGIAVAFFSLLDFVFGETGLEDVADTD
jgi:hypothetical protein